MFSWLSPPSTAVATATASESTTTAESTTTKPTAAHAMEAVITFKLRPAARFGATERTMITALRTLFELRRAKTGLGPSFRGPPLPSVSSIPSIEIGPAGAGVSTETVSYSRVPVRNTHAVSGIVRPRFRSAKPSFAEFAVSIAMEEVIVHENAPSEPVEAPSPTAPSAASAEIEAE
jgi:hypothetical protein